MIKYVCSVLIFVNYLRQKDLKKKLKPSIYFKLNIKFSNNLIILKIHNNYEAHQLVHPLLCTRHATTSSLNSLLLRRTTLHLHLRTTTSFPRSIISHSSRNISFSTFRDKHYANLGAMVSSRIGNFCLPLVVESFP